MTDSTPLLPSFSLDPNDPNLDPNDPANAAPTITSDGGGDTAEVTIAEVTTAMTSDPDAGTLLSYAIVGGADQGHFAIDAASGVLTFVTAPDFMAPTDADGDNGYEVQVAASDGTLFDTQAITVYVTGIIG